ncbi:MAG: lysophospholipid acyltransferase family protein [Candidatus Kapabacteria bacterium]|nr:lysophospholipid acyltransferase family protein [Candidatus Kapabacteria bacterium]
MFHLNCYGMQHYSPFEFPASVPSTFQPLLKRLFRIQELETMYRLTLQRGTASNFLTNLLRVMNVRVQTDRHEVMRLPKQGACVAVANHPFGGIDGIALTEHLLTQRSDVKVVANSVLARIPELHEHMIFVNPFGGKNSVTENLSGLRQMIRWLQQGGMLVVFPAGEVASFSTTTFTVQEAKWSSSIASIIRATNAMVVPCCIHGVNSVAFQVAGMVNSRLRTVLLGKEFLNKQNSTLQIRYGTALSCTKVKMIGNDSEIMSELRSKSLLLKHKPAEEKIDTLPQLYSMPIDDAIPTTELEQEIEALPDDCLFQRHAEYDVYCATAQQIPSVLKEIGRLREVTYRFAGEGTGNVRDNDTYDQWYEHLFIWNSQTKEIVGSYRIGRCDEILAKVGVHGLYTNTLFSLKKGFLQEVSPSLELGRSFVRVEYQKSYVALMLLWKAIGEYLVRNPQYRFMFGPVSISNDYSKPSVRLLLNSLMVFHYNRKLSKAIIPRTPLPSSYFQNWDGLIQPHTQLPIDELSDVISELEHDRKGVPVLMRQYMKLGGEILGFNRDANFNNAIDAFLVVDLHKTNEQLRTKFMNTKSKTEEVPA